MSGALQIKILADDQFDQWDAFVEQCPEATFFHQAGWFEVILSTGHTPYFFYAERDGVIEGILPLGHIRSLLFGNSLISVPFCVYGGVAALNDEARQLLDQTACDLGQKLGVDAIDFRNRTESGKDRIKQDLYVTFRKTISADDDENLKAIPRKQRAVVRKGIKSGLSSVIDADSARFYPLYSESVRNLGTPVMSRSYFDLLLKVFGSQADILTIENNGVAVSSVLNFYFRDEVLPYYGGGGNAARRCKANDFMYWEVMRRAAARGINLFDFGRSKQGTGSYRFKTHWGFEPEPLHYEYVLVNASEPPNLNPTNPKYQYFISAWKRLPLAVSQSIGPWLARNLA
ncbi:MAG TPA: FemAB family PEP-CTERM system-associated protein [Crenotrichaceae bacterium]|nr:FemAB family PEP-CTERM system-associated protein [Crenotrichaceae bacterium]